MTFVSYAQNCEDVVLWRALMDVKGGSYIDVGAADPDVDSVTKAFYERGWSGINVEPAHFYFERLEAARPRDLNVYAAAGARAEVRTLNIVAETGLSTLDGAIARRHADAGHVVSAVSVPVLPLSTIAKSKSMPTIHFLKIDVEGAEADVLEGIDLDEIRPWIVLVEATEPNSQVQTRRHWEHLLVGRRYDFAYFDGLNCFYVADEHRYLKQRLAVPPNVFDDFMRESEYRLREQVAELPSLREQVAELPSLREQVADLPSLREQVAELPSLREQVAELPSLREQVSRLEQRRIELTTSAALVPELRGRLQRMRTERVDAAAELSRLRGMLEQMRSRVAGMDMDLMKRDKANAAQSAEIAFLIAERRRLGDIVSQLTDQALAVQSSHSWRLTSSLRAASTLARRVVGKARFGTPASALPPPLSSQDRTTPTTAETGEATAGHARVDSQQAELDRDAGLVLLRLEAEAESRSAMPNP
jgi:FkbM family methyltransferase